MRRAASQREATQKWWKTCGPFRRQLRSYFNSKVIAAPLQKPPEKKQNTRSWPASHAAGTRPRAPFAAAAEPFAPSVLFNFLADCSPFNIFTFQTKSEKKGPRGAKKWRKKCRCFLKW